MRQLETNLTQLGPGALGTHVFSRFSRPGALGTHVCSRFSRPRALGTHVFSRFDTPWVAWTRKNKWFQLRTTMLDTALVGLDT